MNSVRQLLVGLPETGKSTFIGALSFVAEREDFASAMRLVHLGADDERLNALTNSWLRCERPERTRQTGEHIASLTLEDQSTGQRCSLLLPDLAGETFESHWEHRQCSREYYDQASEANEILLFVHPDRIEEPTRIEDILDVAPTSEASNEDSSEIDDSGKPAPTQVVLVDLLQSLTSAPFPNRALRVSVLVSAWDVVERTMKLPGEPVRTPDEWLQARLPLLSQFLSANTELFEYRTWGVSAQGGDYEDEEALRHLRQEPRPAHRIRLVSDGGVTHDLTEVVQWLMAGDSSDGGNREAS